MKRLVNRKYLFDDFELDAEKRILLKQGVPVALFPKAFDLLLALVERRGEVVSKDELLDAVWEGHFVEQGILTVHISALRKALGQKKDGQVFIVTRPGIGYSFVADLNEEVVSENRRFSSVVVQEEVADSDISPDKHQETGNARSLPALAQKPASRWLRSPARLVLAALGILIFSVVGYSVYSRLFNQPVAPFQKISIKRLTNKGNIGYAQISPDGKLFAYVLREGDRQGLWVGHVDGGEPIQIRPAENLTYLNLKFAQDGSSLYYIVREGVSDSTLFKMPVFGGTPQKIFENIAGLTFSPDGRHFAFMRNDEKQKNTALSVVETNGANPREIASIPGSVSTRWNAPAWSPDGLTIAVTTLLNVDEMALFTVNVTDGSVSRVRTRPWRALDALTWLKDGSGLIATGVEQNSLSSQLWYISVPSGEARRVITDLSDYGWTTSITDNNSLLGLQGLGQSNIWVAASDNLKDAKQITFSSVGGKNGWEGLVWTPDGRIIYSAQTTEGINLWISNADGSKPQQLIPGDRINGYPSVTADGRFLVFQSNRSGHFAVWRSNLDGGDLAKITGDQTAGQPAVSPDGKWVVYNSRVESEGELWRISIDGGEPFRLTDKKAGWAAISPDSKVIACSMKINGESKYAILPIDGGEPLKVFDFPKNSNPRLGIRWTPDGKAFTYRDWADGIWKQNIDGGAPQRIEGLPHEKLFCYGWSPDGKHFAYTRGGTSLDVVLITPVK